MDDDEEGLIVGGFETLLGTLWLLATQKFLYRAWMEKQERGVMGRNDETLKYAHGLKETICLAYKVLSNFRTFDELVLSLSTSATRSNTLRESSRTYPVEDSHHSRGHRMASSTGDRVHCDHRLQTWCDVSSAF